MNIKQLEKILEHIQNIETIIKEDNSGASQIIEQLNTLTSYINRELKDLVWQNYKSQPKH